MSGKQKNAPLPQRNRSFRGRRGGNLQNQTNNRKSRSRNRSKSITQRSRSNSRSRSRSQINRNQSRTRPYGYCKKIHVPSFGNNQLGIHSISSHTFDVEISQRNDSPTAYTTIDYLVMALYFAVFAKYDGRTLQNRNVKGKESKKISVNETIHASMVNIISKFPIGIKENDDQLNFRLHDMFGAFYRWFAVHGFDANGGTVKFSDIRPKSDWFNGWKQRLDEIAEEGGSSVDDTEPKL